MKKILAIFDGTKYSPSTTHYAIEMASNQQAMLVGVFISDMRFGNFTYSYAWDQPFVDFAAVETSQQADMEKIKLNISLFNRACDEKGVHHKVHLDKGVPVQEVIRESVFADMLIIDTQTSFFSLAESMPGTFLKDILADAYCPVLVVPQDYSVYDKVILCYDGSPSSAYAAKQFSYLLPELAKLPVTLVSVNTTSTHHVEGGSSLKELMSQHYPGITYEVLNGTPEEKLYSYLKENGANSIVLMGAYGRSALARIFQQSMSTRIIKDLNLPVFITHQ